MMTIAPYSTFMNAGIKAAVVAMIAGIVFPGSGFAATKYVSVSGSDTAACGNVPSSPCKTIGHALNLATSGGAFGRVVLVGDGVFGEQVVVTSSAEIMGDGVSFQGIQPAKGDAAITVNGASADLRIRNLQFLGNSESGAYGVLITQADKVSISNVHMYGFATAAVSFKPSNGGSTSNPHLNINDSTIAEVGNSTDPADLLDVAPSGSGSPTILINNTVFRNCSGSAIKSDSSGMTGGSLRTIITNSQIAECNVDGVDAISGSAASNSTVQIANSLVASFGGSSISANGSRATVVLSGDMITRSNTGVTASNGGTVASMSNNHIGYNGTNIASGVTLAPLESQ